MRKEGCFLGQCGFSLAFFDELWYIPRSSLDEGDTAFTK